MVGCAAFGCTNRSEMGVRMFGFPKDALRRRQWLAGSHLIVTRNYTYRRLCVAHFEGEHFTTTKRGQLKLKADAVPSIFATAAPKPPVHAVASEHSYCTMNVDMEGGQRMEREDQEVESSHMQVVASTQTARAAPPPLKREIQQILLCEPDIQNQDQSQGVVWPSQTVNSESQTDDSLFKVVVLPLLIPVCVSALSQSSQCSQCSQFTPTLLGLPILSNFSEDLDTDDLISNLDDWQEDPASGGLWSNQLYLSEKLPPNLDIPLDEPVPPPQPAVMDIESEFPIETLELMAQQAHLSPSPPLPPSLPTKLGQSGGRGRGLSRGRGQRRLQSRYGADAWRSWVAWRRSQGDTEPVPRAGRRSLVLKEEVLRCSTAELRFGLSRFICEARRPGGRRYSPDSLVYLCLCIQQYLRENGRRENIFLGVFYGPLTTEVSTLLREFTPTITASGLIQSRVEEDQLWACHQLGSSSPAALLLTLLFFCTKHLGLRTSAQHRRLSFTRLARRPAPPHGHALRLRPADAGGVATQGEESEEESEEEGVLEMVENRENPLRCPVRLYDFYLSKCSAAVKRRSDVFYLRPERRHADSPLWFSSTPLAAAAMETMLALVMTVREVHLTTGGGG